MKLTPLVNFFNKKKTVEPIPTEDQQLKDQQQRLKDLSNCTSFYYLDRLVSLPPQTARYKVQEQLSTRQIITHKEECSYEEMASYVRMIFLPAHPPKLLIQPL